MTTDFEGERTSIKVVGIGGGGGNAVEHMLRCNVQGVEFITANTDAQALDHSTAPLKLPLGNTGLGAGAKPDKGQDAARAKREEIREALTGANMVFITAGMGGGTGTGAAPVVAEVAKEMGILTVGVVTKPFTFEGGKRMRAAEQGIKELTRHVDSLIVILNDRLMEVLGGEASFDECFQAADDVLKNAVGGIAEIINQPGLVNVDFEDVRTVMTAMGRSMMGSAMAVGPERAMVAANEAIASPLLEGIKLSGAKGVLVNISAPRNGLKMREVTEVMEVIHQFADDDAHVIYGVVYDESLGEAMRVTVVATGLATGDELPDSGLATGSPALNPAVASPQGLARQRGQHTDPDHHPAVTNLRQRGFGAVKGLNAHDPSVPAFLRRNSGSENA